MDYYSGKEEDWESFIEKTYKSNQNQPEKAKYSDINDSIILIDDEIAILANVVGQILVQLRQSQSELDKANMV